MNRNKSRTVLSSEQAQKEIDKFVANSDTESDDDEPEGDLQDLHGSINDFEYNGVSAESSDSEVEEETPRRRKLLTAKRLVNSIENALNSDNYDQLILDNVPVTMTGTLKVAEKKDEKVTFSNQSPPIQGRQAACDVMYSDLELRDGANNVTNELEAWELFIPDIMIEIIVLHTNHSIRKFIEKVGDRGNKYSWIKETDSQQIKAFLGLMYYRGLYSFSNIDVDILFSEQKGIPIFGATMGKERFKFLLSHISFDDSLTRSERWKHDRFAAFREVFELFNDNCTCYLTPGQYLSLDETLYPMRTQLAFRQYNPDKPAKYGMLFKSLNSAGLPYLHRTTVYAGKPEEEPTEFYLQGTQKYVENLVEKTLNVVDLQGRNISMDRLYTSIPLARWLLERKITSVGKIMQNRSGLPLEIKDIKDREELSTKFYWEKKSRLCLGSYVVKTKSKGKKNVLLLTTLRPLMGVTKDDDKKKPAVYKLYDFTKGGTDECDKRVETCCIKPKSRRWTIVALSCILDMARVNACTILALKNGKQPRSVSSFQFIWNLIQQMIIPHIQNRPINGLSRTMQLKIELVTGKMIANEPLPCNQPPTRKRCMKCMEETQGDGHKAKKQKLPKMTTICSICNKPYCKKHLDFTCKSCSEQ